MPQSLHGLWDIPLAGPGGAGAGEGDHGARGPCRGVGCRRAMLSLHVEFRTTP